MRKAVFQEIHKLARQDARVLFVGSDIGSGTLGDFKKEFPDRFFMEGVFEANLVGFMAGLALSGKIPFFNTLASFMTRRAYEQIFLDAALHGLKLRLVGSGGGTVYAPLGPTHVTLEDLAIMRAIPGMTILCPADEAELRKLMPQTLEWPGPIYIRLAKGAEAQVTAPEGTRTIAKACLLKEGKDALLVTTGITAQLAMDAARLLEAGGISAAVLHCHTVKPLDGARLIEVATGVRAVLTVEEHSLIGGLGSAVSDVLFEAPCARNIRFAKLGFADAFCHHYGSQNDLLKYAGITGEGIADKIKTMM